MSSSSPAILGHFVSFSIGNPKEEVIFEEETCSKIHLKPMYAASLPMEQLQLESYPCPVLEFTTTVHSHSMVS